MAGLRRQLEERARLKLATLRRGDRDGRLAIVSRDLTRCLLVPGIAPTLQAALDDWSAVAPRLAERAAALELSPRLPTSWPSTSRSARRRCRAPITGSTAAPTSITSNWCARREARRCRPRSGPIRWCTRAAPTTCSARATTYRLATKPGASISRPRSRSSPTTSPWAPAPADAAGHIKLLMLVNDWSLRDLIPGELAKGFGFYQSKPATAFSPVAVTPDELGDGLARQQGPPATAEPHQRPGFRPPDAGTDMTFSFAQLIAHVDEDAAARRRRHRRLGNGVQLRPQPRQQLPGREAHARAARARRTAHTLPAVRRPRLHRDARRATATAFSARSTTRWSARVVSPFRLANQPIATSTMLGLEHTHQIRGIDARPGSRARHH